MTALLSRRIFFKGATALLSRIAFAEETPECQVGQREVLLTASQRRALGLDYWPDGSMGFLRSGTGIDVYAASAGVISKTKHNVARGTFSPVYTKRAIRSLRSKLDYAGGGPVIRQADGSILLMYHAERHLNRDSRSYYSTLGIAKSTDDGYVFVDLGEIITPEMAYSVASGNSEIGGGGFLRFNSGLYAYFRDLFQNGAVNSLAIARSPANPETTEAWKKYFQEAFSEPGVGGRSSPLNSRMMTPVWFSVAFCEYTHLLAMVYAQPQGGGHWELRLAWSKDGLHWSPSKTIEADVKESLYPSFLGFGDDPTTLGRNFYIYYTTSDIGSWSRWQDAALVRREISVA